MQHASAKFPAASWRKKRHTPPHLSLHSPSPVTSPPPNRAETHSSQSDKPPASISSTSTSPVHEPVKSTSASTFDFSTWIDEKKLSAIRHIFEKHDMTSLSTLSMQSTGFLGFIGSVSATQPSMVADVVSKLQELDKLRQAASPPTTPSSVVRKIRATEQEFAVEDDIKVKLKKLEELSAKMDKLHAVCSTRMDQKNRKCTNIIMVENDVSVKFDDIATQTREHRANIVSELSALKAECADSADELRRKMDLLCALRERVESEKQYEQELLQHITLLFNDHALDRRQRKQDILAIGHEIAARFDASKKQYEEMLAMPPTLSPDGTDTNAELDAFDLQMVSINERAYNKLIRNLPKFGRLNGVMCTKEHENKIDEFVNEGSTRRAADELESVTTTVAASDRAPIGGEAHPTRPPMHEHHSEAMEPITRSSSHDVVASLNGWINGHDTHAPSHSAEQTLAAQLERRTKELKAAQSETYATRHKSARLEQELAQKKSEVSKLQVFSQRLVVELDEHKRALATTLHQQSRSAQNQNQNQSQNGSSTNDDDAAITAQALANVSALSVEVDRLKKVAERERAGRAADSRENLAQIADLQRKLKTMESALKSKDNQIKKLRGEVNKIKAQSKKKLRAQQQQITKLKSEPSSPPMVHKTHSVAHRSSDDGAQEAEEQSAEVDDLALEYQREQRLKAKAKRESKEKSKAEEEEADEAAKQRERESFLNKAVNAEQRSRLRAHQHVIMTMEKQLKPRNLNGKQFVEGYCKFAKYGEVSVEVEYVGKKNANFKPIRPKKKRAQSKSDAAARKQNEQIWKCTIKIDSIGYVHFELGQEKRKVTEVCYEHVASELAKGKHIL